MSRKKTAEPAPPEDKNTEAENPTPETTPQPWWRRYRMPLAATGLVVIAATPFAMRLAMPAPQPHIDKPTDQPTVALQQNTRSGPIKSSTWSSDYKVMLQYAELYDELHPFIYSIKGRAHNPPDLASGWGHTQKLERVKALRAKNPKIKIIPTIFRWETPGEKIHEVIGMGGRNDIRDQHIDKIMHEVETYGYDGIDIDYEGMSCGKKEKFEQFIVLLSQRLKQKGKLLSVAVHPKTSYDGENIKKQRCAGLKNPIVMDFRENWRGPLTHDYAFLGKHADMVKIMAYELHPRKYRNPGPGPQAPGTWLAEIIEYARDKIPADKLYMAIPTYGYDWGLNCKAPIKAVYYSDVQRIRAKEHKLQQPTDINKILDNEKGAKSWTNLKKFRDIHDEKIYEDPSLWYSNGGCKRVAFFMDRTAFAEKMNLLQKSNVAGFSFWQLTKDNDPDIQQYLSTTLAKTR